MDELQRAIAAGTDRLAMATRVFRATWREAVGRRWPDLSGDVEALCELARAVGFARGSSLVLEGVLRGEPAERLARAAAAGGARPATTPTGAPGPVRAAARRRRSRPGSDM